MIKYIIIPCIWLFSNLSLSKDFSWYDLELKNNLYYEKEKNILFTGEIKSKKNGKIIKGLKEGAWLEYWEDGTISSITNYEKGKYEGEYLSYYKNGQLNVKANYIDNKKEGEFIDYYETGQINWKENYKNGKVDGLSIIYHENGNLWYKTNVI